jgi:hypothetical protein
MKTISKRICIFLILAAIAVACNYPGLPLAVTSTPTTGAPANLPSPAVLEPTAVQLPATAVVLPSATLPPAPAFTMAPPPTRQPTETRAPTRTPLLPASRGKFVGTFNGGKLVLRVNDNGTGIAVKEVVLNKATCNSGKTVSTRFDYPAAAYALIQYNQFNISTDDVTITGYFNNPPTSAAGTVRVQAKSGKGACVLGPVDWTAVLQ